MDYAFRVYQPFQEFKYPIHVICYNEVPVNKYKRKISHSETITLKQTLNIYIDLDTFL